MELIELVITISEDEYKRAKLAYNYDARRTTHYEKMIAQGIPLPKTHGDIVDIDTVTVEEDVYNQCYKLSADTLIKATESEEEQ